MARNIVTDRCDASQGLSRPRPLPAAPHLRAETLALRKQRLKLCPGVLSTCSQTKRSDGATYEKKRFLTAQEKKTNN